jgi:hypothetical protein
VGSTIVMLEACTFRSGLRVGCGSGIGHAPFRRVTEFAVSRSVLGTVSFPGRACHPLNR